MYGLLLPILLILPKLAPSSPLEIVNSLSLTNPKPPTSNTLGFEPMDPGFAVWPLIGSVVMNSDEWLLIAVEAMGKVSALPLDYPQEPAFVKSRDPRFQAEVDFRSTPPGRAIKARYFVWGLYSGIKDVIALNRFCESSLFLHLNGVSMGYIVFKSSSRSLPGRNLTNTLPQKTSPNESSDFELGNLDVTDSTYSIPLTSPKLQLVVTRWGELLPRTGVVTTIIEALYITASNTPNARIPDAIIVSPPPFTVQVHVLPYSTTHDQVNLTGSIVATALSLIPDIMLAQKKWQEMHFNIKAGDDEVALGLLVKPGSTLDSSANATSIARRHLRRS